MELVKEFFLDVNPGDITKRQWKVRRAVRALVRDGDKIAVMKSTKRNYYKCLPGGGIEDNEDLMAALQREIQEEVGCEVKIIDEIGMCIEYIGDLNLVQISYVFVVNKIKTTQQKLTAEEINDGFVLEWYPINEVIALINKTKPMDKRGNQQMLREKTMLEYYLSKN